AQALRLNRELKEAVAQDRLADLFDLEETAINSLLETVKEDLQDAAEVLTGDLVSLDASIDSIKDKVGAQKLLEVELSKAGVTIAKRLQAMAQISNNPDSLLALSDALAKLQTAFFKSSSVQIANFNGQGKPFEEFLGK